MPRALRTYTPAERFVSDDDTRPQWGDDRSAQVVRRLTVLTDLIRAEVDDAP